MTKRKGNDVGGGNDKKSIIFMFHNQNGFIALTSIIIMSAFFVVMFTGMFISAASRIERIDEKEFAVKALGLANSCVEVALDNLKNNYEYEGDESMSIGGGSCEILEFDSTYSVRVVKAEGSFRGHVKRMQVEVNIYDHPYLEIMDWRVVSSFSHLDLD